MTQVFQRSAVAAAAYSFLSLSFGNVFAQTAHTDDVHRLEEVTITARNLEGGVLIPAQQLSGAALTQRQGSTLGETLDNLPGIANSSFGPMWAVPSFVAWKATAFASCITVARTWTCRA